ncbi:surface antigen [Plasmodium falciparum UGT5.1]|uniref:Surface antigen n=1 Tax=Plasmodium falciparum UGT5.1 TaxID=1237627 RepID=W7JVM3_PLAFA|nr:surface antigen [Plasmodium falciparum UGT5.1]
MTYITFVEKVNTTKCVGEVAKLREMFCSFVTHSGESALSDRPAGIADYAAEMAEVAKEGVLEEGASVTSSLTTGITASIIAIVVIVLVMVYSKNKPSITSHHTQTNRSLCECDTQSTNYNNDEDMKSVKENFDRQTSQRFEEYEKRMIKNRKKCKEQCDKDIQQIILKDKIETSLAEKVEKGCLRCGCGLGGVALGVGIIGPIAVNEWAKAALLAAEKAAIAEGTTAGIKAGIEAGVSKTLSELYRIFGLDTIYGNPLKQLISVNNFNKIHILAPPFQAEYKKICLSASADMNKSICAFVGVGKDNGVEAIAANVKTAVRNAEIAVQTTTKTETARFIAEFTTEKTTAIETTASSLNTAIIASILAIVVIVIVIVIIYLILRYRRKKKMKKKFQYIKLLKE